MWKAITILLSVTACGADYGTAADWCASHRCDLTPLALAPVQGGDNVTPIAISELRAGTGLDFIEDDFGVPVRFVSVLEQPGFDGDCGIAVTAFDHGRLLGSDIQIVVPSPLGCRPAWATLMHEAMHAFLPRADHTKHGLFAEVSNTTMHVDAEARALLCDGSLGECDQIPE